MLAVANNELSRPRASVRTLAYRSLEGSKVEVYDLDFAAYCLMRDLPIADMVEEMNGRRSGPAQYRFVFADPDALISALSVDYTNSESARHADCVRRLKKAIRSTRPREA